MRAFFAIFLLLLFSTQAFPVSALSKSYAKSQISIADDIGDADEDDTSMPKSGDKAKKQSSLSEEDYDHSLGHAIRLRAISASCRKVPPGQDFLYGLHSGEVSTPPPNYS